MKTKSMLKIMLSTVPILIFSGAALAQDPPSACVELGALAWNNWTKIDAGGTGDLPTGVTNKDYIRCKACHGWDRSATDGGYARRSRKETRPNAGFGDGDTTSRAIANLTVTAAMIAHDGTGRSYAQGTGSWVDLNDMGMHSSGNKAAHSSGYTLGNQHPDFSGGDLAQEQVDCLAEFLNFEDADQSVHFANMDSRQNPVLYTLVDTADGEAGETFYNSTCFGCHGDPATDHQGGNQGNPGGGILAYLSSDGKFSEIAHAARWGIPGTIMSRGNMGSPSSQNLTDMMKYLQDLGGTGFAINPGLSGNWQGGATRDGEGLLLEVATSGGTPVIIVSFYTYDSMGNQAWIIGAGLIDGNQAVVNFQFPEGAMWGENFDPNDLPKPRQAWGTGTFTFTSCSAGHMALVPNTDMQGRGFTDLAYDLKRDIVTPGVACPGGI